MYARLILALPDRFRFNRYLIIMHCIYIFPIIESLQILFIGNQMFWSNMIFLVFFWNAIMKLKDLNGTQGNIMISIWRHLAVFKVPKLTYVAVNKLCDWECSDNKKCWFQEHRYVLKSKLIHQSYELERLNLTLAIIKWLFNSVLVSDTIRKCSWILIRQIPNI